MMSSPSSPCPAEAVGNQMKLAEMKQECIRQTLEKLSSESSGLLLLTLQWKDLEEYFESVKGALQRSIDEAELKWKQMVWKQKYVKQKTKEIETKKARLEEELMFADDRRKEIDATYQLVAKCYEQVREKEKEWDDKLEKVKEEEERLDAKEALVARKVARMKKRKRNLASMESRAARFEEELALREKNLGSREMEVMKRLEEVELKEEEFEVNLRRFEKREKGEMGGKLQEFELRAMRRVAELEVREKNLGIVERELVKRFDEVEFKEKKFLETLNEFKRRERELEEKSKEIELREGRLKGIVSNVKAESLADKGDDEVPLDPSYADIRLNVIMDGRALQMFLNGRVDDHEKMRGEVIRGLQMSSDPAKLVLDAMQGFYLEDLVDEDVGFDLIIVRKSCILLLEQLMQLKPRIRNPIRERAMQLAVSWKWKMNVVKEHYLEVVGFLQLVATYGLGYGFNREELTKLVEIAAQHPQAPELCKSLGLTDKVPDIIPKLIECGQPFEAIRLVFAFQLPSMFPPVPILRAYLRFSFFESKEFCDAGGPTTEKQCKAIGMKINALLAVLRCVMEYKLESEYPVDKLRQLILLLRKQKKRCQSQLGQVDENQLTAVTTLTSGSDTMETESAISEDIDMDLSPASNTTPSGSTAEHNPDVEIPSDKSPTLVPSSRAISLTPGLEPAIGASLDPITSMEQTGPASAYTKLPNSKANVNLETTGNKRPRVSTLARDSGPCRTRTAPMPPPSWCSRGSSNVAP